jgi:signal transduction histidine kinase
MAAPHFLTLFRTRLLLLMMLLAIPALGLVLYGHLEQRRIETARVQEGAVAIAQVAAANQESFINNSRQLLATLADLPFLVLVTNPPAAQIHFSNLRKLLPDYSNFGLIETNGTLFCSGEPTNPPVSLADRSYFQRVMQTRKFATGDFLVGRLTGARALNFGYPVLDEQGKFKRVLYASLKLSRLSDALAPIRLPNGATVMVIDRAGNVLAHQPEPEQWVGRSLSNSPVVQRILAHQESVFEMPGVDGVARLHAVTAIANDRSPGLFACVGIPVTVSFARANQALVRNLLVFGLVAAAVWIAVRFYSRRFFLRPVNALGTVARQLAEGNLNARAGPLGGAAELAQLGRAFDEMAHRLQERREEIGQAHEQIRSLNQALEARVAERTAQLEAANQELEAFSYSVSHDLRAPLRAIDGFSQALQEDSAQQLDKAGQGQLRRVREAAERMGQLIDALLGLARVTRSELRPSKVNLSELAESVVNELRKSQPDRQVEVVIMPGLMVTADASLLRIVLENLLGNAWKFTARASPAVIEVGMIAPEKQPEYFVRDNGAGFEMDYAAKLFEAFQRLHSAADFEGTGIGLATVRRIIQRHGGRVRAEGAVDKGATFYFTLP